MVIAYLVLLALVALERMVELRISNRNIRSAFAQGGIERGKRHFVWMKLLHTGFLVGCAVEVVALDRPFVPALGVPMLALALAAQGLRYWAVTTLGPHWNVRVVVVPGASVVTKGPYRHFRHPNYLAVILEGVALPLIHGAWLTALSFTVLNALLLTVRIRCEEQALGRHCDYGEHFAGRHRWFPWATEPKE